MSRRRQNPQLLYAEVPPIEELMSPLLDGDFVRKLPKQQQVEAFVDYCVGALKTLPLVVQPYAQCEWEFGSATLLLNPMDVDAAKHGIERTGECNCSARYTDYPLEDRHEDWCDAINLSFERPGPPWHYVRGDVIEVDVRSVEEIMRVYEVPMRRATAIARGMASLADLTHDTRIPEPIWIPHADIPPEFYDDIMATGAWTFPRNQYGRLQKSSKVRIDSWKYIGARHPGAKTDEEFARWLSDDWKKTLGLPDVPRRVRRMGAW